MRWFDFVANRTLFHFALQYLGRLGPDARIARQSGRRVDKHSAQDRHGTRLSGPSSREAHCRTTGGGRKCGLEAAG